MLAPGPTIGFKYLQRNARHWGGNRQGARDGGSVEAGGEGRQGEGVAARSVLGGLGLGHVGIRQHVGRLRGILTVVGGWNGFDFRG